MKRKKPTHDEDALDIVLRHWPHVPAHARRTIVELVSVYKPRGSERQFPTPADATWVDVEIVLLSSSEARITVGAVSKSYTFSALGLADNRRLDRSRLEWRMLRTYAENPEPDAYYKLPYRRNLKVEISKFRRWLQGFFCIPGDPLRPFESDKWLPRFKIRAE